MSPVILYTALCLVSLSCVVLALGRPAEELQLQQQADETLKQNVSEEMQLITKSLEDLLAELGQIKREATGRLSSVKNRASPTNDQDRIRQTKVSRFVLTRVAELESESLSMREEFAKLFNIQSKATNKSLQPSLYAPSGLQAKQEDLDFDEPTTTTKARSSTQSGPTSTSSEGMPSTTTMKPDEEAAKIGFDMEALKKLGEEIGKRLDQFGKDAAKNLADLMEGVKLVFREPNSKNTSTGNNNARPTTNGGANSSPRRKIVYDIATLAPPKAQTDP